MDKDLSSSPDIEAIKARVSAATPGPWGVGDGTEIGLGIEQDEGGGFYFDAIVAQATYASERDGDRQRAAGRGLDLELATPDADAEFIAAARTDVPALLAEVARLQARVDVLTGQVAGRDATIQRVRDVGGRVGERLAALLADEAVKRPRHRMDPMAVVTDALRVLGEEMQAALDGDPAGEKKS